MKKGLLLTAIFVFSLLPINIMIGSGGDLINWDANKPLTWKDFRKDEPKTSKHKLHSAIGIVIDPEQKDDYTMIANVNAAFNRSNSSKPDEDKQTDDALHHEQLRFDLAEVHARMERKQLPDSTYKNISKFYMIAKKINNQADAAFKVESAKYDSETKFGADATAQQKWDKYVADQLDKYSGFSADNTVEITIQKKIVPIK